MIRPDCRDAQLPESNFQTRSRATRTDNHKLEIKLYVRFPESYDINDVVTLLKDTPEITSRNALEEFTADSGYCSEKNLLYLKENQIDSYIKLQDHEKRKTVLIKKILASIIT